MKTQTTNMLRTAIYTATITALLGLPAAAAAGQMRPMARTAGTTPQQQSQASTIARSDGAMAYKWPAMLNHHQQAKAKAAQSRRTAAVSPKPADDAPVAGEALAK